MTSTLRARPWRAVEQVMGLPISVALRGRHAGDEAGSLAWRRVVADLRAVDATFSRYRADSVVSRLDRGELSLDQAPPEVHQVLVLGEQARIESHGAFDVRRPDASGHRRLDLDGVVKGWATQRAARHLTALPDTDACLSAGGDLVCWTADPAGPAWRIGIEHPADAARLVATVPVTRGAVATSGTAHRGQHIVDARTGRPPGGLASVTVVAADLTWADIDATAAFALGPDAEAWLRGRPGRTALVVDSRGGVRRVAGRSRIGSLGAAPPNEPVRLRGQL